MGWNDNSGVVNLLRFKILCKINFCFALVVIFLNIIANHLIAGTAAEQELNNDKEKISYKIKMRYPFDIYSVYKFNEITEVKRTYSDSSVKQYKREVNYFFTQHIADLPEADFQKVKISCDSMIYSFTDGSKTFTFNSQDEQLPKEDFFDFTIAAIPYSRNLDITYSPYGDVAKIEGDDIEWLKDYILVKGKDILDTLKKFVWLNSVSDEHLKYLYDMLKGLIPTGFVASDSVWKNPFNFVLDGIYFTDTASVRIAEYKAGTFTIESISESLKPRPQIARLYDINKLVDINSGNGKGYYILKIDPNGMVASAEAEFESDINASIKKEKFTQYIKSKIYWQRINQYKF